MLADHDAENRSMRFSPLFCLLTGFFFLLLGALSVSRSHPSIQKGHYSRCYSQGDLLGLVTGRKISESGQMTRFEARVVSVDGMVTRGKIFLTLRDTAHGKFPEPGDTLVTKKPLRPIVGPANPGGFDFRRYAAQKKVIHQLSLREGEYFALTGTDPGISGISYHVNQGLQVELEKALEDPGAIALAKALLLGYRHELSRDLLEGYKEAGAMHILAISGLHVGIILIALLRITRPLGNLRMGKSLQMTVVVLGLWAYALVTGMAVSAVRAVSMFSLLTLGRLFGRDAGLMRNLVTSAFVLLLIDPLYLFDVGFQLSYSALAGIGLFTPFLRRSGENLKGPARYILQLIGVSCSAQLGVLPLSLLYFKQFSGVFLISSLVLLPVLGFTLSAGYAVLLISMFTDPPAIVALSYEGWLQGINLTVQAIGSMEALIVRNAYFPISFCLLTYLSLVLLYLGIQKNKPLLVYLFGLALLIMQLDWLRDRRDLLRKEELVVFHQWKESLVARRRGRRLYVMKSSSDSEYPGRVLDDYASLFPGRMPVRQLPLPGKGSSGFLSVGTDLVMILDDSPGRTNQSSSWELPNPEVLVLVNSPGINLERLLRRMKPGQVVADGSNYPSFVRRWRQVCEPLGISFHATSEQGAFRYPLRN